MTALVVALREVSARVNAAAIARMYENPFWEARYGERGHKYTEEDGRHHLSYLAEALMENDVAVLTRYAAWLQSVLTARGMCTRHLAENFLRLAELLAKEPIPKIEQAVSYLREAARALEVSTPALAALSPLAARAASAAARSPELADEARTLFSYLADAVSAHRPELFAAHVRWNQGFLIARGHAPGVQEALLAGLGEALTIAPELPAALREAALKTLEAARGSLGAREGKPA